MTLLYHLFDLRYVYLGKTTKGNRWKIGIAKDTDQRWRDIDRQIPGSKERPVFHARCLFAGRIERALHRRYDRYRVRERGWGREWFRLPLLSRIRVVCVISMYSFASVATITTGFVLFMCELCEMFG